LFERAHLLIAAAAERVQGQRRFEHEDVVSLLNDVSREVRNLNEDEQVLRVMVSHLPRIGVPRFYVGRQVTSSTQQPSSQLLVAHGLGSDIPVANSLTYPTGELLPGALLPQSRHTLVVLRLAFEDVPRWFYAAELGPTNGLVYESIREMLSAGLKNASLLRQVIAEVSRSERAERVRIEREMQLAQRIQCEILPKAHPVDGLEITATMVPASEVGGDYYDVLPFDRGCWLGIGDVVGHGLDTGLIMMMIQSIVAATTRSMPDESPKAIWRIVNAILYENIRNRLGRDEHATLCLLRYERDGRIVFAGAHEDLIVLRAQDRHCELVPTRGVWAGICAQFDEETVELGACQLQVGDLLILYTDGITEAMNPRCEMFGTRRLCETVQHVWDRSTREINDHVMETVLTWSNVLADDRTLVVARYTGG
jgi:serine phosphatase RsbU (regulator of sigma subunit)